ncbi:hypothetical protein ORI20_22085 [Mycobacterium sp. CVI_P3]|uniref:Lipoprotein LppI n=1 Tax=Mycobacterium pinniadriaticum TaxID=2994102 RepID=A0ABT3SIN1_9MYCO|nr:hypothetical protein [Mycobacterium pinniadriaticum]MCX2932965.1 hypothetical protein [Mycobacterium pinniadriaticum]MCX2939363.1 hypothetical protein [Mycobacterium pinniadriaticum]
MRIAVLLTASLLVAGCSGSTGSQVGQTQLTPITPSRTATSPSETTSTTSSTPAPTAGMPIADAIKWIEAAPPIDASQYHIALRGGVTTELGEDVAFTTPAGTTCMTDAKHGSPALACLVDLTNPPPRPPDAYGQWKGGWVDFDGGSVQVGSAHGDPGRFAYGQGRSLPYDTSLSFGDYRCRTDTNALFCVNYAHQAAVRLSAEGVDAYACARQVTPPAGIGEEYVC